LSVHSIERIIESLEGKEKILKHLFKAELAPKLYNYTLRYNYIFFSFYWVSAEDFQHHYSKNHKPELKNYFSFNTTNLHLPII
jgi:hypothetical protein